MHTVTVTHRRCGRAARCSSGTAARARRRADAATDEEELDEGPSPIAPEVKELLWGLGAFLVFLVLMRLCLVPKVKKGMDGALRHDPRRARDAPTRLARRGQARGRRVPGSWPRCGPRPRHAIDAARRQLEAERAERLAEVNAAHRRAPRRRRGRGRSGQGGRPRQTVDDAVVDVAAADRRAEHRPAPDEAAVRRVVADVVECGGRSMSRLAAAARRRRGGRRRAHRPDPPLDLAGGLRDLFGGARPRS